MRYNLVLLFHSLHGLVRGENMELGRDSDTGGQVLHILTHLNHKLAIEYLLSLPLNGDNNW